MTIPAASDADLPPLPAFQFRGDRASLWTLLGQGVRDVSSVIPAAILDQPTVDLGAGAPLVVAAPDLAHEVLRDRADQFTRDKYIRRLFRRSWGEGLAGAEGEAWQRQRRAAAPFFTPRAVTSHLDAFAQACDAVIAQMADGEEVELATLAARIVARIVLSVLVDAQGLADPDAAAADVPAYVARLAGFTTVDLLPLPERLIDRIQGIDRDPAVQRLRAMGDRLAAARGRGTALHDMIALLEGKGPVGDNIRGLFPAAMDTTVAGLAWMLYTLALRPEWQEKVAAEGRAIRAPTDLNSLENTRRVVCEVLRLYPPAPLLARSAARAVTLAGHRVRAGQSVIVAVYALHRHRSLWDHPDAFDPDRFRPGAGPNDGYMPFGTGPRMCIAAQFAQAEMAIIAARMLARFDLGPSGPPPVVTLQATTRSATGLRVIARRRD